MIDKLCFSLLHVSDVGCFHCFNKSLCTQVPPCTEKRINVFVQSLDGFSDVLYRLNKFVSKIECSRWCTGWSSTPCALVKGSAQWMNRKNSPLQGFGSLVLLE